MREDKKITYSADVGEVFGIIDITHDKRVGYIAKLIVCLGFMQVLPIKRVCLAILKKKKGFYILLVTRSVPKGKHTIPGINRRPFILCYQSSLLFFPPAFAAIRLFIILGIGIHRVFHSLLMGVEENVL